MSGKGQMAGWSYIYVGDRPRSVLKLTEQAEATITQFIGFSGTKPNNEPTDTFILVHNGTSVNLTLYSNVPIGTIILTPRVPNIFCYQRIAQATPGQSVNADWNQVAKAAVS